MLYGKSEVQVTFKWKRQDPHEATEAQSLCLPVCQHLLVITPDSTAWCHIKTDMQSRLWISFFLFGATVPQLPRALALRSMAPVLSWQPLPPIHTLWIESRERWAVSQYRVTGCLQCCPDWPRICNPPVSTFLLSGIIGLCPHSYLAPLGLFFKCLDYIFKKLYKY